MSDGSRILSTMIARRAGLSSRFRDLIEGKTGLGGARKSFVDGMVLLVEVLRKPTLRKDLKKHCGNH